MAGGESLGGVAGERGGLGAWPPRGTTLWKADLEEAEAERPGGDTAEDGGGERSGEKGEGERE